MGKVRVIELFGGIGACTRALSRAGIEYEVVDYVEIDKYAVASYNAINGTNFGVQDICEWDKEVGDIDLVMHGSPCQDFSVAGKQAGGDEGSGTRSSLMYETLRIIGKVRPRVVIWENVKNLLSKKHRHNFDNYLSRMEELGYKNYWEVLNAKDYGVPQNRERVFTVSIKEGCNQGFEFPAKQELKIRLKDVLEDKVEERYYLSDKMVNGFLEHNKRREEKGTGFVWKPKSEDSIASTLRANAALCPTDNTIQEEITCERIGGIYDKEGAVHQAGSVWCQEGLSPTLDTMGGGNRQPMIAEPKVITTNVPQTVRVRKHEVDIERLKVLLRDSKKISNKEIAESVGKPLTLVEHWFRQDSSFAIPDADVWYQLKDVLGITTNEFDEAITEFEEREGVYDKANRVYSEEGLAPTLTQQQEKIIVDESVKPSVAKNFEREKEAIGMSDKEIYQCECDSGFQDNKVGLKVSPTIRESSSSVYGLDSGYRIRKLTPKECWRLMGFKDSEFERAAKVCSNSQLYKQAGNSIVVNVLEGIVKNLFTKEGEE